MRDALQNALKFPFRDLDKRGRANQEALEAWAAGPKDHYQLVDREVFPREKDHPPGTVILVRGALYALERGKWRRLVRESQDSAPIPWWFQGSLDAATPYDDEHFLPLLWPCVIPTLKVRISPALGAGETFVLRLKKNGVTKETVTLSGTGETKGKERPNLKVDEDDEVNIEVEHSAAVTDFKVQALVGIERL